MTDEIEARISALMTEVFGAQELEEMTPHQRMEIRGDILRMIREEGAQSLTKARIQGIREILFDYVWGNKAFR